MRLRRLHGHFRRLRGTGTGPAWLVAAHVPCSSIMQPTTHNPQVLLIGNAGSEVVRLNSIGLIPFNQRSPTHALRAVRAFPRRQGSAHPSLLE